MHHEELFNQKANGMELKLMKRNADVNSTHHGVQQCEDLQVSLTINDEKGNSVHVKHDAQIELSEDSKHLAIYYKE